MQRQAPSAKPTPAASDVLGNVLGMLGTLVSVSEAPLLLLSYLVRTQARPCDRPAFARRLRPTMDSYDEAVLFTLAELESRLHRLEYLLGGPHKDTAADKAKTVPDRIHCIERSLQRLAGTTTLLHDTRELGTCAVRA